MTGVPTESRHVRHVRFAKSFPSGKNMNVPDQWESARLDFAACHIVVKDVLHAHEKVLAQLVLHTP